MGSVVGGETCAGLNGFSASRAPIADAIVSISGRYQGIADAFGVVGWPDYGDHNYTQVSAVGYVPDYRYIDAMFRNIYLYPNQRITAGEEFLITVTPTDTLVCQQRAG